MSPRAGFHDLPAEIGEDIVGYFVDDEPEMRCFTFGSHTEVKRHLSVVRFKTQSHRILT